MKLVDNSEIHAEAKRQLGIPAGADPAALFGRGFDTYLKTLDAIKSRAGRYQNVVICEDCSSVHNCPFGAFHENAHDHLRVCGSCASRAGFRDVVGCWIPFPSIWWKPSTWGRGCWAFDFRTAN